MLPTPNLRKSLRIDTEQLIRTLDHLEQQDGTVYRNVVRYRYRHPSLRVSLGTSPPALVAAPARWIADTRLAFLHGCLLYTGTPVQVTLITLHGTWDDVAGEVETCRYVGPHVYDVVVRWTEGLDPGRFSSSAVRTRAMIASDDPFAVRLLTAQFSRLNAEVRAVDPGEKLAANAMNDLDLLLLDFDSAKMLEFIEANEVRRGGTAADVVGLSSGDAQSLTESTWLDRVLEKPVHAEEIESVVSSLRREPLVSTLAGDAQCQEIIAEFVTMMPEYIERMRAALRSEGNDQAMRGIVQQLGRHGRVCGFSTISEEAARVAERMAAGSGKPHETWVALRPLLRACGQIEATNKAQA